MSNPPLPLRRSSSGIDFQFSGGSRGHTNRSATHTSVAVRCFTSVWPPCGVCIVENATASSSTAVKGFFHFLESSSFYCVWNKTVISLWRFGALSGDGECVWTAHRRAVSHLRSFLLSCDKYSEHVWKVLVLCQFSSRR